MSGRERREIAVRSRARARALSLVTTVRIPSTRVAFSSPERRRWTLTHHRDLVEGFSSKIGSPHPILDPILQRPTRIRVNPPDFKTGWVKIGSKIGWKIGWGSSCESGAAGRGGTWRVFFTKAGALAASKGNARNAR